MCLERGADLHMARRMLLPLTVSCFCKIQIGFTFLMPAHLGSPGKVPLNGRVCVCVGVVLQGHLLAHCQVHGISDVSESYSLGGSSDAAFCCQYCGSLFVCWQHQLPADQQLPSSRMLEFSRHHQEAQLASKQKQSLRQLTEDEVRLDDHLQQLYRLDRVVQEHSFNVTSLHEDQVLLVDIT